jgi:type VI secretion system protein ImpC
MMRDKVGSVMERRACERFLNEWINEYVIEPAPDSGQELLCKHPLREARIEVMKVPDKPGAYKAVAYLRPHFQLDEITVSLRLVAELPPAANPN